MFAGIDRSTITNADYHEAVVNDYAPAEQADVPLARPEQPEPSYVGASPEQAPILQDTTTVTSDQVVAAFDCARAGHKLPAYQRDPELDAQAKTILQRVLADPTQTLAPHENGYTLTGQLMLDPSYPQIADCMIGGFDVAQVKNLAKSQRIGVAMGSVQVYDQDLYLTIVVGF